MAKRSYEWVTAVGDAKQANGEDSPSRSPTYAATYATEGGKPKFPSAEMGVSTLFQSFRSIASQRPDRPCLGSIRPQVRRSTLGRLNANMKAIAFTCSLAFLRSRMLEVLTCTARAFLHSAALALSRSCRVLLSLWSLQNSSLVILTL
jgi:hypothetical protein